MLRFTNVIGSILMAVAYIGTVLCYCYPGCDRMCGKANLYVLFVVLLILVECHGDNFSCQGGAIYPTEPYFLSGQEVSLTCITKSNTTNLTFLMGQKDEPVDERYIHRFNQSVIQMVLPKMTKEKVEEFKFLMHFRCVDIDGTKITCFDNVFVQPEHFPMEAKNITCRVNGWRKMNCMWDLGVVYINENDTNVTCEVYSDHFHEVNAYVSEPINGPYEICPNLTRTGCFWNESTFTDAMSYKIKINVRNMRTHNYTSSIYLFNRDDVVEPDPVENLMVTNMKELSCVNVSWKMPPYSRSVLCTVSYSSNCDRNNEELIIYPCNTSYHDERVKKIICGLTPHVSYMFTVTNQQMGKGFISKPERINVMTTSDVPRVSPEVTDGLYDDKYVYYKPIDECQKNGESVKYIICQFNGNRSVELCSSSTTLFPNTSKVTILASNSHGTANVSSTLNIFPKDIAPHQSELIIEYNITGLCRNIFAMIKQNDSNSETFSNISHVFVHRRKVVSELLVQWTILEQNKTQFRDCNNSEYGLVTKGFHKKLRIFTNTGIKWTRCLYEIGKVPLKPLTSRLVEVKEGNMRIVWDHYNCDDAGYILHYLVTYCFVRYAQPDSCSCTEDQITEEVPNTETSYEITNLKSGFILCAFVLGVDREIGHLFPTKPLMHSIKDKESTAGMIVLTVSLVLVVVFILVFVFWKCVIPKYHKCLNGLQQIDMPLEDSPNIYAAIPGPEPSDIVAMLQQTDRVSSIDNTSGLGTSTFHTSENGTNKDHSSNNKPLVYPLNASNSQMHTSNMQNGIGSYGNPLFLGRVPGSKGQRNSSGDYVGDPHLHGYNQASEIEINNDVTENDSVIDDSNELPHEIVSYIMPGLNMDQEDMTDCDGKEQHSKNSHIKIKMVELDKRTDHHDNFMNLNKKKNVSDVVQLNTDSNIEIKEYGLRSKMGNIMVTATVADDTKFDENLPETNPGEDIPLLKNYQNSAEIVKILEDSVDDSEDEISELCDNFDESKNLLGYKICPNEAKKSLDISETVLSIVEEVDKEHNHFLSYKSQDISTRSFTDDSRISETQDQVKEEIADDQIGIKNEEAILPISDEMDDEPTLANYKSVKTLNLPNIEQRDVTKSETSHFTEISLNKMMKTRGQQIDLQEQTLDHHNMGSGTVVCNSSTDSPLLINYAVVSIDSNQQQRLKAGSDKANENKFWNGGKCLNGTYKTQINTVENS